MTGRDKPGMIDMSSTATITAGAVMDQWFRGEAGDADLIAFFLPTGASTPLERLRRLAQAMNFASQLSEYAGFAIVREGERTSEAIALLSKEPNETPMFEATRRALEDHYDALQLMVEALEDADETGLFRALTMAEQAEATLRTAREGTELVSEHLKALSA